MHIKYSFSSWHILEYQINCMISLHEVQFHILSLLHVPGNICPSIFHTANKGKAQNTAQFIKRWTKRQKDIARSYCAKKKTLSSLSVQGLVWGRAVKQASDHEALLSFHGLSSPSYLQGDLEPNRNMKAGQARREKKTRRKTESYSRSLYAAI